MSKKLNYNDRRVIRTQKLLKNALVELIDEVGFDKITVQDISNRATVNRATFYLHFHDKYDLLDQSMEEVINELHNSFNAPDNNYRFDSGHPYPIFINLFEKVAEHANFCRVMLTKSNMSSFKSNLQSIFHEFISKGLQQFVPDDRKLTASREFVVVYVESAFLGTVTWWLENDRPYSPKFMATQLMNLAIKGPYVENPFEE
ncbi:TetR/AcrR family transcriptional regulator [Virgibacillus doumboii]|uniref:TetR/AcrR family transcriptional regulator n=1 Tax=Virgibacillus doumboii TaxID=2697503 RepID=UPI0013DEDA14|nr:TetR/AcrR family transcriptional regulator [Virgibacillus doumboii]